MEETPVAKLSSQRKCSELAQVDYPPSVRDRRIIDELRKTRTCLKPTHAAARASVGVRRHGVAPRLPSRAAALPAAGLLPAATIPPRTAQRDRRRAAVCDARRWQIAPPATAGARDPQSIRCGVSLAVEAMARSAQGLCRLDWMRLPSTTQCEADGCTGIGGLSRSFTFQRPGSTLD